MTETTKIILTGIASSGFTIFLTKILDLIQDERAHRTDLKKQFFEKKLFYAEKTIEYINERIDIFDRAARILKHLEFISKRDDQLYNAESFDYFKHLDDLLLKDINEDDLFTIKIPGAFWLYFDLKESDLPNKKLNIVSIQVIKELKRLENVVNKIGHVTEEESKKVQALPHKEQLDWATNRMQPLIQLQASFQFWSKELIKIEYSLKQLADIIGQDFKKYK